MPIGFLLFVEEVMLKMGAKVKKEVDKLTS
jgi:hypothetical protein